MAERFVDSGSTFLDEFFKNLLKVAERFLFH
jgi:hypothetical protein